MARIENNQPNEIDRMLASALASEPQPSKPDAPTEPSLSESPTRKRESMASKDAQTRARRTLAVVKAGARAHHEAAVAQAREAVRRRRAHR